MWKVHRNRRRRPRSQHQIWRYLGAREPSVPLSTAPRGKAAVRGNRVSSGPVESVGRSYQGSKVAAGTSASPPPEISAEARARRSDGIMTATFPAGRESSPSSDSSRSSSACTTDPDTNISKVLSSLCGCLQPVPNVLIRLPCLLLRPGVLTRWQALEVLPTVLQVAVHLSVVRRSVLSAIESRCSVFPEIL